MAYTRAMQRPKSYQTLVGTALIKNIAEMPVRYITDVEDAWKLWHEIEGKTIAIDIEAEFNCHVYGEHLALIQVAWDGGHAIVDPLGTKGTRLAARESIYYYADKCSVDKRHADKEPAHKEHADEQYVDPGHSQALTGSQAQVSSQAKEARVRFEPSREELAEDPWIAWLHSFFDSPDTTRIVFGAQSDASLLLFRYGVAFEQRIDLACAVGLLDYEKRGLESVLKTALGVVPKGKEKFQQYNWLSRPLDPDALGYAIGDVDHLFALHDLLFTALEERGLLEEFWTQNNIASQDAKKEHRRWLKAKGYKHLPSYAKAKFTRMFIARDAIARALDRPPHRVVANQVLLSLCKQSHIKARYARSQLRGRVPADLAEQWVDACCPRQ